ncbi:hypothetical protein ACFLZX_06525 [Nanoarchaeota archaeon]
MIDDDLEQAKVLKDHKRTKKERDFNKAINKKDLGSFEMDELFLENE